MAGIVTKAMELVTSNLTSLLESATHPEKMLRLLRAEIEESIIGLQDTLTKANRHYGRVEGEIARLDELVQDWASKAKLALDKGRDDLARGALQAREAARADMEQAKAALAGLTAESDEAEAAIARLEGRLSEIRQQIGKFANTGSERAISGASGIADRLDRIGELERRIDNASANRKLSEADLGQELRKLAQDEKIDADLETLKELAGKRGAKKKR